MYLDGIRDMLLTRSCYCRGAGGPPKSKAYANPLASRAGEPCHGDVSRAYTQAQDTDIHVLCILYHSDEIKYRTKYKQLRGKVKEIEEVRMPLGVIDDKASHRRRDSPYRRTGASYTTAVLMCPLRNLWLPQENAKMQAKILKTKRQIQRLRLERRYVHLTQRPKLWIGPMLKLDSSILYDRFQEAKNAGTLEHTSIPVSSLQPQLSSSVPFGTLNASSTMHHHHPSHQQQPPHLIHPQSLSHQPSMFQHSQTLSQGYHPSQFITHPGLMHDGNDSIMMNALHHDMQGVDPTMSMSL